MLAVAISSRIKAYLDSVGRVRTIVERSGRTPNDAKQRIRSAVNDRIGIDRVQVRLGKPQHWDSHVNCEEGKPVLAPSTTRLAWMLAERNCSCSPSVNT